MTSELGFSPEPEKIFVIHNMLHPLMQARATKVTSLFQLSEQVYSKHVGINCPFAILTQG